MDEDLKNMFNEMNSIVEDIFYTADLVRTTILMKYSKSEKREQLLKEKPEDLQSMFVVAYKNEQYEVCQEIKNILDERKVE